MKWYKVFNSVQDAENKIANQKAILVKIGERRFALARSGHNFFATADACPHNSESLSKGWVNHIGEIVCPWHNYRFNLQSGRECNSRTEDLETFPIEERENGLFLYA